MTTVYRLPEEPPVGTTVRPEPDTGERYTSEGPTCGWRRTMRPLPHGMPGITYAEWSGILKRHPNGVVIVEPDPHPTPWRINGGVDRWGTEVVDASGEQVFVAEDILAERIIKAVNEATT